MTSLEKLLRVAEKLNFSEEKVKELESTYSKAGEIEDEYRGSSRVVETSGENN